MLVVEVPRTIESRPADHLEGKSLFRRFRQFLKNRFHALSPSHRLIRRRGVGDPNIGRGYV